MLPKREGKTIFSYYGSKGRLVKKYAPPAYDHIIEPFAGSARYAMAYPDRRVTLIDKFHKIVEAWRYLRSASTDDILALPDIEPKDDLRNYPDLPDGAKWMIGFQLNGGTSDIRYKVTGTGTFNRWRTGKPRIAQAVNLIRHWEIIHGDYRCLSGDLRATWYVDPPYVKGGQEYRHGNKQIDYIALGAWCRSLHGQVIVCENSAATWLPFRPLAVHRGSNFTTTEVVWENNSPPVQNNLFE